MWIMSTYWCHAPVQISHLILNFLAVQIWTHLDNLAGGEGFTGYVVLIERHINAGGQDENGQVHFNGFVQWHLAGAGHVATDIDATARAEAGVVAALHPSRWICSRNSRPVALAACVAVAACVASGVLISFVLAALRCVGFSIAFVRIRILYNIFVCQLRRFAAFAVLIYFIPFHLLTICLQRCVERKGAWRWRRRGPRGGGSVVRGRDGRRYGACWSVRNEFWNCMVIMFILALSQLPLHVSIWASIYVHMYVYKY